jgi:DNA-binding NarL/FixJ family response regulator
VGAAQRVLVVDDDPDYRLVVRLALAGHPGFCVVGEADDGPTAAAEAARAGPDVVLLDSSLPGGDAFDVLPALRRAAPDARIVLVSGYDAAELDLASRAAGTVGFLPKGTPARRLAGELEALAGLVEAVQAALAEVRTRLDRDRSSPRAARHFVTEALRSWQLDGLADTVTLLVSELVTNAVVHADSDVEVLVRLTADAAVDDTSGRGLALVEAMARRWGVDRRPGGGKTVWFEVERA